MVNGTQTKQGTGSLREPITRKNSEMQRMTFKINEVAELLGISRTTIYKLIGQGELQRIKVGATTLIAATSVDSLLERNAA